MYPEIAQTANKKETGYEPRQAAANSSPHPRTKPAKTQQPNPAPNANSKPPAKMEPNPKAPPRPKANTSQSALRHDLSATKFTLLANEDPAQYNEFIQAFITDFQPVTKTELRLVERLANLDWRMERFALIETCLLNMAITENYYEIDAAFDNLENGVAWIASGWRKSHDLPACLTLLARYMGTLQHQYNSTSVEEGRDPVEARQEIFVRSAYNP